MKGSQFNLMDSLLLGSERPLRNGYDKLKSVPVLKPIKCVFFSQFLHNILVLFIKQQCLLFHYHDNYKGISKERKNVLMQTR